MATGYWLLMLMLMAMTLQAKDDKNQSHKERTIFDNETLGFEQDYDTDYETDDNKTDDNRLRQQLGKLLLELLEKPLGKPLETLVEKILEKILKNPLDASVKKLLEKRTVDCSGGSTTAGKPPDCAGIIKNLGSRACNGEYTIYIGRTQRPVQVYCDMTTTRGGWTVFQRRKDGLVDFYRTWNDYKRGFGCQANGEFWLGNDKLHLLTSKTRQRLRIELADWEGNRRYAEYDNFKVGSEKTKYKLISIGKYTGNAGDSLKHHLGMKFSTKDQDNDVWKKNCAAVFKGAWWYYRKCHVSNLNGLYKRGKTRTFADGVVWYTWMGHRYSMKYTEMKIRPYNAK